jgi:hypothetical protein
LFRELARQEPLAIAAGESLARSLAASIIPDDSWLDLIGETQDSVRHRIEPLAKDPRLRGRLARACAVTARRMLAEIARRR